MKTIFFLACMFLCAYASKAQLFEDESPLPGVETIKVKYYNGAGGPGYHAVKVLDDAGRVKELRSYRRGKLLARDVFAYNAHGDEYRSVRAFDINHPEKADTAITQYRYNDSGEIVYQCMYYRENDSLVYQLLHTEQDSIYHYKESSYGMRPGGNAPFVIHHWHTVVKNADKRIVRWATEDREEQTKEIRHFTYYPNGNLKRKVVEQIPVPREKAVYIGGPGSEDMSYEYDYDKKERVRAMYTIVEGQKLKLATYNYK